MLESKMSFAKWIGPALITLTATQAFADTAVLATPAYLKPVPVADEETCVLVGKVAAKTAPFGNLSLTCLSDEGTAISAYTCNARGTCTLLELKK